MPYSPSEEVQRPSLTSVKLIAVSKMDTELKETCLKLKEDKHLIFRSPDSDTRRGSGTVHSSWLAGFPRHVIATGKV